jgi:hypothetical protein
VLLLCVRKGRGGGGQGPRWCQDTAHGRLHIHASGDHRPVWVNLHAACSRLAGGVAVGALGRGEVGGQPPVRCHVTALPAATHSEHRMQQAGWREGVVAVRVGRVVNYGGQE